MHIYPSEGGSRTHVRILDVSPSSIWTLPTGRTVNSSTPKRLAKQLPCPLRFLRQLSIPTIDSLPQPPRKCLTPVVLGCARSFHLVGERLDPLESFVDRHLLPSNLAIFSSGACVRILSTCPRSLKDLSKLKRRLQLLVEVLPSCCRVQSSSKSSSSSS